MNPDTIHPREEEAIAYAMGLMAPQDVAAFETAIKADPTLRALVADLQSTTAALTFTAPMQAAPAEVKDTVLQSTQTIRQEAPVRAPVIPKAPAPRFWTYALGAAAAAAVLAVPLALQRSHLRALASERSALQKEVEELKGRMTEATKSTNSLKQEIARLSRANSTALTQIAMLQATVSEYKQGVAVVVWNPEKQEGILKLEKMPQLDSARDYQLWVVDPAHPKPISAGVVRVNNDGFAKVDFKPVIDIDNAKNFAISVEKAGGVKDNEGPIVLLSQ
jgi:anti-sigma-K factor RskA